MKMDHCNVVLNEIGCQVMTKARCFACGNTACPGCSKRMDWYRFKRVRVCNDCQEEKRKDERYRHG
jgi:hypothetical protein